MSGWTTVSLGEVCEVTAGGTPSRAKPENFGGGIPWVKISDMLQGTISATEETITRAALDSSAAKLLPPGTVLISIFATIGRTAVLGVEAATNQAIAGVTPRDPNTLTPNYLRHYFDSVVSTLERRARGVAQVNINSGILKALRVPLPPLLEQQRIAEVLDKADALRAKRRSVLAQLDTLTRSIFLDMFGDPATNPKRFPRARLDSLVREGDSINYGVVQPGDECEDGVPLVRVGDLQNGAVDHVALKRISSSIEAAYKRSRLRGDEILISCVGSIGTVALADPSVKGFNIARAVARVAPAESIDRVYLANYLRTDAVQRYFESELRTVSQPTLNIKQISETIVLLPPREHQREFALRVEAVMRLRDQQQGWSARSDALFASIQANAFRGEM